jgi:hypothetical protein
MKQVLETKFSTDYLENIKILLARCSHKQQVEFALHCAKDCQHAYDRGKFPEVYKATNNCLELLKNWISDSKSVTEEQLETAAKAAHAATYAANAANAAANAAYAAANATYAALATTNAAFATASFAYAARSATANLKAAAKLKQFYDKLFTELTENLNKNVLEVLYE